MNIAEFISQYRNHPVLFIGTGISLRYLENSYTWDGLLSKIAFDLKGDSEFYFDLKAACEKDGKYKYDQIATLLEKEFNEQLKAERHGKFAVVNNQFYENMERGNTISRFKIYIAHIFSELKFKQEKLTEITQLKKIRKNISSIITTNYDSLIEETFEFHKLIGNDILLSNPYGSVYKIHGCSSDPGKMIITAEDYSNFNERYELIRAQLLSLFIHNPIIFMGYKLGDENIKSILKTIFTYIQPNSDLAKKIKANFLLVEYEEGVDSNMISDHDIDMDGFAVIRINKIKTDNFSAIYEALSNLQLPVSAMDIRKVQTVVKDIYSGGDIKVNITEDLNSLNNEDKIIVIGSTKTITYQYMKSSETVSNYFNIIDESNSQLLSLIDKYSLSTQQWFPIFGFNTINMNIGSAEKLKRNQLAKIEAAKKHLAAVCKQDHTTIKQICDDERISLSLKESAIFWSTIEQNLNLDEVEYYLRKHGKKNDSSFKRILCAYDYVKYKDS